MKGDPGILILSLKSQHFILSLFFGIIVIIERSSSYGRHFSILPPHSSTWHLVTVLAGLWFDRFGGFSGGSLVLDQWGSLPVSMFTNLVLRHPQRNNIAGRRNNSCNNNDSSKKIPIFKQTRSSACLCVCVCVWVYPCVCAFVMHNTYTHSLSSVG